MSEALRICLLDQPGLDGEAALRFPLQTTRNALLIGEASSWEELIEWLRHDHIDLLAVNFDTMGDQSLDIIRKTVEFNPACGILGVGSHSDPSLIIAAMRAGCNQFVPTPIDQKDLQDAVERIRSTRINVIPSSRQICVIGSSGGAGATMVACNLALELSRLCERSTGLVDLNLEFGDIDCAFDCEPIYTVNDVCRDGIEADRFLIEKAIHQLPSDVCIMAKPREIRQARNVTPEGISNMLRVMATMYRHVVIDLPRAFSFLSAAAVQNADKILIVTQLGVPFIRNATRIYECLLQMGANEDSIEIVLNRYQASHSRISPEEVETHFKRPLFALIPNDYERVQSAIDFGHPIVTDAPNSSARVAIQEMAKRIAMPEAAGQSPQAQKESPGLLRRLLGASA